MKARIWAIGAVMALLALLVVAWIMGDAQPTRWIETPVAVTANGSATAPVPAPISGEQP